MMCLPQMPADVLKKQEMFRLVAHIKCAMSPDIPARAAGLRPLMRKEHAKEALINSCRDFLCQSFSILLGPHLFAFDEVALADQLLVELDAEPGALA